ncbi:RloB domain-containing protein [Campylobacter lari]|nr:RloB domain-containing protein [Campylobacter lari]
MNKKTKPSIQIWYEGKTEEDYFNSLFKYLNYDNVKIDVKNLKNNNSYKNILYKIEKAPYIDKLIIVMDLDRAKSDTNELKILEKLIKHIKKSKDIHLFLTLDDFEDWLRFHFVDNSKNNKTNFYKKLGYSDSKNFKSSTNDLYSQILNKGGCIENAEKYFYNIAVFCNDQREIDKNSLNNLTQSNLYYFRKLLEQYNGI